MTNVKVKLASIQDVRNFVDTVTKFNIDIDLSSGRYVVDAKSIMGIFSLDLLNPINLTALTDDADEEKALLSSVRNWDETSGPTVSLHVHAVLFHYLIKLQPHLPEFCPEAPVRGAGLHHLLCGHPDRHPDGSGRQPAQASVRAGGGRLPGAALLEGQVFPQQAEDSQEEGGRIQCLN